MRLNQCPELDWTCKYRKHPEINLKSKGLQLDSTRGVSEQVIQHNYC